MYGKKSAALRSIALEEILDIAPVMRGSDLALRRAHSLTSETVEPPAELGELFPKGIAVGGTAVIRGNLGWGASTLCYRILAAANDADLYAALLDPARNAMPAALLEAGIWPDRFVLVRPKTATFRDGKLLRGLEALIDGFPLVGILDPLRLGGVPWLQLAARARERRALTILVDEFRLDVNALFYIELSEPEWKRGPDGLLESRSLHVGVTGLGQPRSVKVEIGSKSLSCNHWAYQR